MSELHNHYTYYSTIFLMSTFFAFFLYQRLSRLCYYICILTYLSYIVFVKFILNILFVCRLSHTLFRSSYQPCRSHYPIKSSAIFQTFRRGGVSAPPVAPAHHAINPFKSRKFLATHSPNVKLKRSRNRYDRPYSVYITLCITPSLCTIHRKAPP